MLQNEESEFCSHTLRVEMRKRTDYEIQTPGDCLEDSNVIYQSQFSQ